MKRLFFSALAAISLIPGMVSAEGGVVSASGTEFDVEGFRAVTFSMW